MSNLFRRIEIPIVLTIVAMLLQVVPYYLKIDESVKVDFLESTAGTVSQWVLLVAAWATFIGPLSLIQVHGKVVQKRGPGWYFSVIVLAGTVIMAITGLPFAEYGLGTRNPIYSFLFNNAQVALSGTMYGIIAFFITSAAYRGFRAKNIEATIRASPTATPGWTSTPRCPPSARFPRWPAGLFPGPCSPTGLFGGLYDLSRLKIRKPVLVSSQNDAIFKGYEAKLIFPMMENRYGLLDLTLFSDYTRGEFVSGSDVPRMPPLRYGLQLDYNQDKLASFLRFTRADEQSHAGDFETSTAGYFLLDVGVNYQLKAYKDARLMLFAKGSNLLDQNIRNSTSYYRNFAPEPGRGAEIGFRLSY